jgi:hypothetical protein
MSFLTEAAVRRVASLQAHRAIITTVPRATIATGIQLQKSATDQVKSGLKSVDRAVSDKLVDGINIGCKSCS